MASAKVRKFCARLAAALDDDELGRRFTRGMIETVVFEEIAAALDDDDMSDDAAAMADILEKVL